MNENKKTQKSGIDNIELIQHLLHITGEFVVITEDLKAIIPVFDKSNDPSTGQLLRNLDRLYFDPGVNKLYAVTQQFFNDTSKISLKEMLQDFGVPTDDLPNGLIEKPLSDFKPPENATPNN